MLFQIIVKLILIISLIISSIESQIFVHKDQDSGKTSDQHNNQLWISCDKKFSQNHQQFKSICNLSENKKSKSVEAECCQNWLDIECISKNIDLVCDIDEAKEYRLQLAKAVNSYKLSKCVGYGPKSAKCNQFKKTSKTLPQVDVEVKLKTNIQLNKNDKLIPTNTPGQSMPTYYPYTTAGPSTTTPLYTVTTQNTTAPPYTTYPTYPTAPPYTTYPTYTTAPPYTTTVPTTTTESLCPLLRIIQILERIETELQPIASIDNNLKDLLLYVAKDNVSIIGQQPELTAVSTERYLNSHAGYPTLDYNNNQYNITTLTASNNGTISLRSISFDTENSYDYLRIYNTYGTVLYTFTGVTSFQLNNLPNPVTLLFRTDGSVVRSGFQLGYRAN